VKSLRGKHKRKALELVLEIKFLKWLEIQSSIQ
jgi:hypothetical protein